MNKSQAPILEPGDNASHEGTRRGTDCIMQASEGLGMSGTADTSCTSCSWHTAFPPQTPSVRVGRTSDKIVETDFLFRHKNLLRAHKLTTVKPYLAVAVCCQQARPPLGVCNSHEQETENTHSNPVQEMRRRLAWARLTTRRPGWMLFAG